jgi:hypothetical protein
MVDFPDWFFWGGLGTVIHSQEIWLLVLMNGGGDLCITSSDRKVISEGSQNK